MARLTKTTYWFTIVALLGVALGQTTTTEPTTSESTTEVWPPTTPAPTHPPIPTASAIPLPTEFADIPKSAVECWDSLISFDITRSFLQDQLNSGAVYTYTEFPTPITNTYTYGYSLESCATAFPGLTTLCDGYPRASDCISECQYTGYTSWTDVYTTSGTGRWLTPTWSTELEQLPTPSCTVAEDLSPECSRLAEAYTWRTSNIDPTASISAPPCAISLPPTLTPSPPAQQRCSLNAESYEAYYWPTPSPTNTNAFCNTNNDTIPTATPTIPGRPNTAVVSGLTFTSPSIYHILHNATVYRYIGHQSTIGWGDDHAAIYEISTQVPTLTFAQPSTSILSQYKQCRKPSPHGATRCTISYQPDFNVQDVFTVNAKAYYGEELATPTTATICQASYAATIGLPLLEVAKQNQVGEECEWTFTHSGRTTLLEENMFSVAGVGASDYHAITTVTGVPRSGLTTVASSPTSTLSS
ncbi:unnamed protein product [Periconia digitata]|uniref:Uncharacterized protein n=1 Tax=Periconia digitata TaxID=1303443 RepID=A0A9W4U295_9PLEO|nr:unnamed protein product [Periconia digitata]